MNVTNYDHMADDYNDSLSKSNNCTNNEKNIDIIRPAKFFSWYTLWSISFLFHEFDVVYLN